MIIMINGSSGSAAAATGSYARFAQTTGHPSHKSHTQAKINAYLVSLSQGTFRMRIFVTNPKDENGGQATTAKAVAELEEKK